MTKLNVTFQVDQDIYARLLIGYSEMPIDFANYLWDKYRESYKTLQKKYYSKDIDINIITELQNQPFFKEEMVRAKENCERIKSYWEKNKEKINEFLYKIMKVDCCFEITGCIFAPERQMGVNHKKDAFLYGTKQGELDPIYDLVYIVHESLHSYFDKDDISHVVIENIADIELAKYLNDTEKGYSTHSSLKELHKKIQPFWNLYLNKTDEEIIFDQESTENFYVIEDYEKHREKISQMNINEFVDYLKENINTYNQNDTFKR